MCALAYIRAFLCVHINVGACVCVCMCVQICFVFCSVPPNLHSYLERQFETYMRYLLHSDASPELFKQSKVKLVSVTILKQQFKSKNKLEAYLKSRNFYFFFFFFFCYIASVIMFLEA